MKDQYLFEKAAKTYDAVRSAVDSFAEAGDEGDSLIKRWTLLLKLENGLRKSVHAMMPALSTQLPEAFERESQSTGHKADLKRAFDRLHLNTDFPKLLTVQNPRTALTDADSYEKIKCQYQECLGSIKDQLMPLKASITQQEAWSYFEEFYGSRNKMERMKKGKTGTSSVGSEEDDFAVMQGIAAREAQDLLQATFNSLIAASGLRLTNINAGTACTTPTDDEPWLSLSETLGTLMLMKDSEKVEFQEAVHSAWPHFHAEMSWLQRFVDRGDPKTEQSGRA